MFLAQRTRNTAVTTTFRKVFHILKKHDSNKDKTVRRTNQEFMLLALSIGGAIAITPFAIIRFIQGEWLVGFVDTFLILGMGTFGAFIYYTRNTRQTSLPFTLFVLSVMTALVYLKGPALVYWGYPALIGVYFILPPRLAMALSLLSILAIAPALFSGMEIVTFVSVTVTLVVNSIFVYLFAVRTNRDATDLSLLVRRDSLTGAGNRRAFDEKLPELIAMRRREELCISILILDVDYFKNINDSYGHAIGDRVLVNLTRFIKMRIRASDKIYRIGGEEFVVVLTGADLNAASAVAEKLRVGVERYRLISDDVVTVSFGVAELHQNENSDDWLRRCDKALYHAKETGRNRVCFAD